MRIAVYSDCFVPEISGIVDSILLLGEQLTRMGHDILVVAPNYGRVRCPPTIPSIIQDHRTGPPVHRLRSVAFPGSPTGQWRFVVPLGGSLGHLRAYRPDVIHVHTPFGTGLEAVAASRRLGIPLVGTNHTPVEEFTRYVPIVGRSFSRYARRYVSWFYNHCALVTAPFEGLIDDMRSAGFNRRAKAMPNPVSTSRYRPVGADKKRALKLRHGLSGPVILYAGRLAPEKHIDAIIEAVGMLRQRVPNLMLILTGYGAAQNDLRSLVDRLGLEKSVRFTGYVDSEALVELYQGADVFAMMSTAESQSLALMNAFSCGIPAVAANARALPHYVPPDCGFLVEPGDHQDLAVRLHQLLVDADLSARMGAAAAAFVQQFSAERIAQSWVETYKGLCAGDRSDRAARVRLDTG